MRRGRDICAAPVEHKRQELIAHPTCENQLPVEVVLLTQTDESILGSIIKNSVSVLAAPRPKLSLQAQKCKKE